MVVAGASATRSSEAQVATPSSYSLSGSRRGSTLSSYSACSPGGQTGMCGAQARCMKNDLLRNDTTVIVPGKLMPVKRWDGQWLYIWGIGLNYGPFLGPLN